MTQPVEFSSVDVCQVWAAPEDVFACCPDLTITDDAPVLWALEQASDLLFNLSGHNYPGECTAVVRPCSSRVCCWRPVDDQWCAGSCSCVRLSRIRLAGYPVQSITSVEIDGVTLDPSEYTLYYQRELVRMADADGRTQRWPGCQRLDLASGEGTFFITYKYGLNPPAIGTGAAAQLACEIMKQCPGTSGGDDAADCALPAGTVRITRQGLTIESEALGMWLLGSLRTGLPLVDAFLSVYGGRPQRRRPSFWSPEADPWPVRVQ